MKYFGFKASTGAAALVAVGGLGAISAFASTSHVISQAEKAFSTKKMEVAVGDSITFVNDDKVKHNIVIKKMDVSSGIQKPGEKIDVLFDKNGKFKVRCGIHPKMKVTVVVK
ncbi:cupredoxin domain-containing protein [Denitrobaculum tricleocarpae]|uniref:Blue (type 1) copper domain-containing protein n=1 Tax=Denitrobaculum tricleocarpae TaxID=2591009 RepID=A0A545TYM2_9PROT|nr:plastocyanin/azurin family copper-binding protein [Denitrobaculum tricleocarpae]TQV82309.1 hypothetical protein FKG95_08825 [Denitrobaculum tricleocarpae]